MNFIPQKFKFSSIKFSPHIHQQKFIQSSIEMSKNEIYFIEFHPWNLGDIIAKSQLVDELHFMDEIKISMIFLG
jgi:hypothetical protein